MRCVISFLVTACCHSCFASGEEFYRNFLSLADTNDLNPHLLHSPLLVDTNNTSAKLTNGAIQLDKLWKQGELAGIRLGMTMGEVVGRWGKPKGFYSRCDGGPRFLYKGIALVFRGNALYRVRLPETLVFDKGLTAQSSLQDWIRAIGEPSKRVDSKARSYVYYESAYCVIGLVFDRDGDMHYPPVVELPATTTAPK